MIKTYKPSDFDIVYISYDEPNAEKNWADLKAKAPWAKRVHGVKGFDAAHNKAGQISETDRLFTIDGDNRVRDDLFNETLEIDEEAQKDYVFSWCGHNVVNGLAYGNGGVKLWPKHIITNMKSHEKAESEEDAVDFCWMVTYFQMADTMSDVVVNGSPEQAFRGGYREGVKLSLDRGVLPDKWEYIAKNHFKNLHRLAIWNSVGMDVEYGDWAILGARMSTYQTNVERKDHTLIADYDYMQEFVQEMLFEYQDETKRQEAIHEYGIKLRKELQFRIADLDAEGSKWFKMVYENPTRYGVMLTERDVK